MRLLCAAGVVAVGAPVAAGSGDDVLTQLEGVPLEDGSGLLLLAGGELIDPDTGARNAIVGLPPTDEGWWAHQQGDRIVLSLDCVDCSPRPEVYVATVGEWTAQRIATERHVAPGLGDTLLAQRYETPASCTFERLDLAGAVLTEARPIDCANLVVETPAGIVALDATSYLLLDPDDLDVVHEWRLPQELTIIGDTALVSDGDDFTLVDLATGGETARFDAPPAIGFPSRGLLSPDGRYVAIEYRTPAQIIDLWLLDLVTLDWVHAPSMPVDAFVKRPPPVWTHDGRLAMVGDFGREGDTRHLLAAWRPGEPGLAIREVDGDTMFVVIPPAADSP